jgi:hypothetical protein
MADMRKGIRSSIIEKMTGFNKFFVESNQKEEKSANLRNDILSYPGD